MNKTLKRINDTLFITEKMDTQKDLYRWSPPKELETRFGVEVEACIRTTPDCINFNTEYVNLIPGFKGKFDYYYQNIITKTKHFKKLADKYKFLVAINREGGEYVNYYYDMTNPNLPGITYDKLLEKKYKEAGTEVGDIYHPYQQLVQEAVRQIVDKGINYEIPIFVDDISILCGDTELQLAKEKHGIDEHSFRFECITPILSIQGYPTKDKIRAALYPLLSLFGLDKPACFIQNYSMGFHVNASLYNTKEDKYLAIAESPFINRLLRNYIEVEKRIFTTVRARGMDEAPADYFTQYNQPNYKNFARPLYRDLALFKRVKMDNLTKLEAFNKNNLVNIPLMNPNKRNTNEDQIINRIMATDNYIGFKYKGLKKKSPFLLEFRLFEGESEIGKLVGHVFTALDILHKTANEVFREEGDLEIVKTGNGNANTNRFNTVSVYSEKTYGGRKPMLKTKKRHHKRNRHTRRKY